MNARGIITLGLLLCLLLALALSSCQVGPPTAEQRAATATAMWERINSGLK